MERYKASKNYVMRKIAGKYVLVSVGQEIANFCGVVTLNESASVLWNVLKEGATREDLAEALKEKFEVTEEQAEVDVEETLKILLEREMIANE